MSDDITDLLKQEFPIVFDNMRMGRLECGDGWYQLIRRFGKKCHEHNLAHPDETISVLIIKEKFGGLRIQGVYEGTKEIFDLISELEDESYNVCEICGKPGKHMVDGYWHKTRCEECK